MYFSRRYKLLATPKSYQMLQASHRYKLLATPKSYQMVQASHRYKLLATPKSYPMVQASTISRSFVIQSEMLNLKSKNKFGRKSVGWKEHVPSMLQYQSQLGSTQCWQWIFQFFFDLACIWRNLLTCRETCKPCWCFDLNMISARFQYCLLSHPKRIKIALGLDSVPTVEKHRQRAVPVGSFCLNVLLPQTVGCGDSPKKTRRTKGQVKLWIFLIPHGLRSKVTLKLLP